MKSFLLSALFLLAVSGVFSLKLNFQHADPPHKDCASHTGHGHGHHNHYPQERIDKLNQGEPVAADDSETGQHLLCILKERGIMTEDGIIHKDVLKGRLTRIMGEESEGIKKAEDCAVQHSEPKETAISFYNCVAPLVKKYNN